MQSAKKIVAELKGENDSIDKVTGHITDNPYLSYQLLRVLNNPVSGIPRKITDIREAIIMIGLVQIKKWATLITLDASKQQQNELFSFIVNHPNKTRPE